MMVWNMTPIFTAALTPMRNELRLQVYHRPPLAPEVKHCLSSLRDGEVHLIKCFGLIVFILCPLWAQEGPFGSGLYQVMEKADCRSCHNPDGVASATRLQFPDPGSAPEKIEAFGRSLVTLVDREHPDASLLLKKPTNRTPHGGGERVKPGSPDEAALTAWIAKLMQLSGAELSQALKYRGEEAAATAARPLPR